MYWPFDHHKRAFWYVRMGWWVDFLLCYSYDSNVSTGPAYYWPHGTAMEIVVAAASEGSNRTERLPSSGSPPDSLYLLLPTSGLYPPHVGI
jgi:hypothetical protein